MTCGRSLYKKRSVEITNSVCKLTVFCASSELDHDDADAVLVIAANS